MSRNLWGRPLRLAARSAYNLVIVSPPPGGVRAWFADWRTGTGTSDAVVQDTSKFSGFTGPGNWLNVISASGLGFPSDMTNVLRCELGNSETSRMVDTGLGHWSSPSIGNSIWYRTYFRIDFPNGFDTGSMHPIQIDGLGDLKWEWKYIAVTSGHVQLRWHANPLISSTGSYDISSTGTAVINVNTVYRLEWQLRRTAAATAKLTIRIYDSTGTQIAGNADFLNSNTSSPLSVDDPDIDLGANPDNQFQDLSMGNNGPINTSRTTSQYFYYGGDAVSLTDFNGVYTSSAG